MQLQPLPPQSFNYAGISFQHPSDWEIETEEIVDSVSYYMSCKGKGSSSDIFVVTLVKDSIAPESLVETYLDNIKSGPGFGSEPAVANKFADYNCISANYSLKVLGSNFYGIVYAFNAEGNSIAVVKQSDTEGRLKRNFQMMEESFKVASDK